jgi:hypothetical protein
MMVKKRSATTDTGQTEAVQGVTSSQPAPPTQAELQALVADRIDSADVYYADSLMQLGVGPFVSKLTVGSLSATGRRVSGALTIVIPTQALLELSIQLGNALANKENGEKLEIAHAEFAKRLNQIVVSPP